ncbi:unnamed protein product [Pleuronectes platessa]|uniref:Uncharacterized protein n=1 Tax=Pleuronectes platessa TaxID=8262 RepID=A0A9N7ULU9_PLEPL|nr:unnamed protein product [Pleuronectes platessa]
MCARQGAGASCRQLWATAGARSCRERGALSDFPASPGRVRCAASTSRPTANRDDDDDDGMRSVSFSPTSSTSGPRCPEHPSAHTRRAERAGLLWHSTRTTELSKLEQGIWCPVPLLSTLSPLPLSPKVDQATTAQKVIW